MPLSVFTLSAYLEWSIVLNREDFTKNRAKEPTKDCETSFVEGSCSRCDTDSKSRHRARNLVEDPGRPGSNLRHPRSALLRSSFEDASGEEEEVCGQVRWHTIDSPTDFCICPWVLISEHSFLEACRPGETSAPFALLKISHLLRGRQNRRLR